MNARHAFAEGETITQGHADYCAAHGHSKYVVNGELHPACARCGVSVWCGDEDTTDDRETVRKLWSVTGYVVCGVCGLDEMAHTDYRVSGLDVAPHAFKGIPATADMQRDADLLAARAWEVAESRQ